MLPQNSRLRRGEGSGTTLPQYSRLVIPDDIERIFHQDNRVPSQADSRKSLAHYSRMGTSKHTMYFHQDGTVTVRDNTKNSFPQNIDVNDSYRTSVQEDCKTFTQATKISIPQNIGINTLTDRTILQQDYRTLTYQDTETSVLRNAGTPTCSDRTDVPHDSNMLVHQDTKINQPQNTGIPIPGDVRTGFQQDCRALTQKEAKIILPCNKVTTPDIQHFYEEDAENNSINLQERVSIVTDGNVRISLPEYLKMVKQNANTSFQQDHNILRHEEPVVNLSQNNIVLSHGKSIINIPQNNVSLSHEQSKINLPQNNVIPSSNEFRIHLSQGESRMNLPQNTIVQSERVSKMNSPQNSITLSHGKSIINLPQNNMIMSQEESRINVPQNNIILSRVESRINFPQNVMCHGESGINFLQNNVVQLHGRPGMNFPHNNVIHSQADSRITLTQNVAVINQDSFMNTSNFLVNNTVNSLEKDVLNSMLQCNTRFVSLQSAENDAARPENILNSFSEDNRIGNILNREDSLLQNIPNGFQCFQTIRSENINNSREDNGMVNLMHKGNSLLQNNNVVYQQDIQHSLQKNTQTNEDQIIDSLSQNSVSFNKTSTENSLHLTRSVKKEDTTQDKLICTVTQNVDVKQKPAEINLQLVRSVKEEDPLHIPSQDSETDFEMEVYMENTCHDEESPSILGLVTLPAIRDELVLERNTVDSTKRISSKNKSSMKCERVPATLSIPVVISDDEAHEDSEHENNINESDGESNNNDARSTATEDDRNADTETNEADVIYLADSESDDTADEILELPHHVSLLDENVVRSPDIISESLQGSVHEDNSPNTPINSGASKKIKQKFIPISAKTTEDLPSKNSDSVSVISNGSSSGTLKNSDKVPSEVQTKMKLLYNKLKRMQGNRMQINISNKEKNKEDSNFVSRAKKPNTLRALPSRACKNKKAYVPKNADSDLDYESDIADISSSASEILSAGNSSDTADSDICEIVADSSVAKIHKTTTRNIQKVSETQSSAMDVLKNGRQSRQKHGRQNRQKPTKLKKSKSNDKHSNTSSKDGFSNHLRELLQEKVKYADSSTLSRVYQVLNPCSSTQNSGTAARSAEMRRDRNSDTYIYLTSQHLLPVNQNYLLITKSPEKVIKKLQNGACIYQLPSVPSSSVSKQSSIFKNSTKSIPVVSQTRVELNSSKSASRLRSQMITSHLSSKLAQKKQISTSENSAPDALETPSCTQNNSSTSAANPETSTGPVIDLTTTSISSTIAPCKQENGTSILKHDSSISKHSVNLQPYSTISGVKSAATPVIDLCTSSASSASMPCNLAVKQKNVSSRKTSESVCSVTKKSHSSLCNSSTTNLQTTVPVIDLHDSTLLSTHLKNNTTSMVKCSSSVTSANILPNSSANTLPNSSKSSSSPQTNSSSHANTFTSSFSSKFALRKHILTSHTQTLPSVSSRCEVSNFSKSTANIDTTRPFHVLPFCLNEPSVPSLMHLCTSLISSTPSLLESKCASKMSSNYETLHNEGLNSDSHATAIPSLINLCTSFISASPRFLKQLSALSTYEKNASLRYRTSVLNAVTNPSKVVCNLLSSFHVFKYLLARVLLFKMSKTDLVLNTPCNSSADITNSTVPSLFFLCASTFASSESSLLSLEKTLKQILISRCCSRYPVFSISPSDSTQHPVDCSVIVLSSDDEDDDNAQIMTPGHISNSTKSVTQLASNTQCIPSNISVSTNSCTTAQSYSYCTQSVSQITNSSESEERYQSGTSVYTKRVTLLMELFKEVDEEKRGKDVTQNRESQIAKLSTSDSSQRSTSVHETSDKLQLQQVRQRIYAGLPTNKSAEDLSSVASESSSSSIKKSNGGTGFGKESSYISSATCESLSKDENVVNSLAIDLTDDTDIVVLPSKENTVSCIVPNTSKKVTVSNATSNISVSKSSEPLLPLPSDSNKRVVTGDLSENVNTLQNISPKTLQSQDAEHCTESKQDQSSLSQHAASSQNDTIISSECSFNLTVPSLISEECLTSLDKSLSNVQQPVLSDKCTSNSSQESSSNSLLVSKEPTINLQESSPQESSSNISSAFEKTSKFQKSFMQESSSNVLSTNSQESSPPALQESSSIVLPASNILSSSSLESSPTVFFVSKEPVTSLQETPSKGSVSNEHSTSFQESPLQESSSNILASPEFPSNILSLQESCTHESTPPYLQKSSSNILSASNETSTSLQESCSKESSTIIISAVKELSTNFQEPLPQVSLSNILSASNVPSTLLQESFLQETSSDILSASHKLTTNLQESCPEESSVNISSPLSEHSTSDSSLQEASPDISSVLNEPSKSLQKSSYESSSYTSESKEHLMNIQESFVQTTLPEPKQLSNINNTLATLKNNSFVIKDCTVFSTDSSSSLVLNNTSLISSDLKRSLSDLNQPEEISVTLQKTSPISEESSSVLQDIPVDSNELISSQEMSVQNKQSLSFQNSSDCVNIQKSQQEKLPNKAGLQDNVIQVSVPNILSAAIKQKNISLNSEVNPQRNKRCFSTSEEDSMAFKKIFLLSTPINGKVPIVVLRRIGEMQSPNKVSKKSNFTVTSEKSLASIIVESKEVKVSFEKNKKVVKEKSTHHLEKKTQQMEENSEDQNNFLPIKRKSLGKRKSEDGNVSSVVSSREKNVKLTSVQKGKFKYIAEISSVHENPKAVNKRHLQNIKAKKSNDKTVVNDNQIVMKEKNCKNVKAEESNEKPVAHKDQIVIKGKRSQIAKVKKLNENLVIHKDQKMTEKKSSDNAKAKKSNEKPVIYKAQAATKEKCYQNVRAKRTNEKLLVYEDQVIMQKKPQNEEKTEKSCDEKSGTNENERTDNKAIQNGSKKIINDKSVGNQNAEIAEEKLMENEESARHENTESIKENSLQESNSEASNSKSVIYENAEIITDNTLQGQDLERTIEKSVIYKSSKVITEISAIQKCPTSNKLLTSQGPDNLTFRPLSSEQDINMTSLRPLLEQDSTNLNQNSRLRTLLTKPVSGTTNVTSVIQETPQNKEKEKIDLEKEREFMLAAIKYFQGKNETGRSPGTTGSQPVEGSTGPVTPARRCPRGNSGRCPHCPYGPTSLNHDYYCQIYILGKFKCHLCGKKFKNNYLVRQHLLTHTGEKPFKCPQCLQGTSTKQGLEKHLKTHTGQKFMCEECGKWFSSDVRLKRHRDGTHNLKKLKCRHCDKEFSSSDNRTYHERNRHPKLGEQVKCFECKKKWKSKDSLLQHIMHSHPELTDAKVKRQTCSVCHITTVNIKKHMVTHTRERNFTCNLCPKRFMYKFDLTKHLKSSIHKII